MLYSPWGEDPSQGVFNDSVEETLIEIFRQGEQLGRDDVTVSLNLQPPHGFTMTQVSRLIESVMTGQSGFLSFDTLQRFDGKISISIDPEIMVWGMWDGAQRSSARPLRVDEISFLNGSYLLSQLEMKKLIDQEFSLDTFVPLPLSVYNFGTNSSDSMISEGDGTPLYLLPSNVQIIDNSIGAYEEKLLSWENYLEEFGRTSTALMFFVHAGLGENQRDVGFGVNDYGRIVDYLRSGRVYGSVLALQ